MRVLITRPFDDAEALAGSLSRRGVQSVIEPLLTIEHIKGPKLDLDGVQALVMTSANGVRAFMARCSNRSLPVLAVGDVTAAAARLAGFENVQSASGDVGSLASLIIESLEADGGAVVHAAGSKIAGDLSGLLKDAGFDYRREVLYQAHKVDELSSVAVQALKAGIISGVLFFSPRTAATFANLAIEAGLADACGNLTAFCLSQAVADEADAIEWGRIAVAESPGQESLLAAVCGI